jgi:hypothetical protein
MHQRIHFWQYTSGYVQPRAGCAVSSQNQSALVLFGMAFTRVVKIERTFMMSDGGEQIWRVSDEKHEHEETIIPDQWLRDTMGARMQAFFYATWSQDDGWLFKRRLKEWYHWLP